MQGLGDMAALSNAFARGSLMEAQASGQLPPAGGHSKRSSRDYGHHYDAFSSQASSQLQVDHAPLSPSMEVYSFILSRRSQECQCCGPIRLL